MEIAAESGAETDAAKPDLEALDKEEPEKEDGKWMYSLPTI